MGLFFGFLKIEDKWLLAMIDSVPYIEGRTRLQKFGILLLHEVLNDEKFFDDWMPDNYGGFSQQLAASLIKLERRDCVKSTKV